jgi:hypothetical protein
VTTGETAYVLSGECFADGSTASNSFPNSAELTVSSTVAHSYQTFAYTAFPHSGCSGGNILFLQLNRDNTLSPNMADTSYFLGAQVDIQ